MRISDWSSDVCSSDLENSGTASSLLVGSECIKRFEITGVDEQGQRLDADATGKLVDRHRRGLVEDARKQRVMTALLKIGRAHVCTPVTNAHLVCRLLLEKKH